jgi:hypothetical protein
MWAHANPDIPAEKKGNLTTIAYRYARGVGLDREKAINSTPTGKIAYCISDGESECWATRTQKSRKPFMGKIQASITPQYKKVPKGTLDDGEEDDLLPSNEQKAKEEEQLYKEKSRIAKQQQQMQHTPDEQRSQQQKQHTPDEQHSKQKTSFKPRTRSTTYPSKQQPNYQASGSEYEEEEADDTPRSPVYFKLPKTSMYACVYLQCRHIRTITPATPITQK